VHERRALALIYRPPGSILAESTKPTLYIRCARARANVDFSLQRAAIRNLFTIRPPFASQFFSLPPRVISQSLKNSITDASSLPRARGNKSKRASRAERLDRSTGLIGNLITDLMIINKSSLAIAREGDGAFVQGSESVDSRQRSRKGAIPRNNPFRKDHQRGSSISLRDNNRLPDLGALGSHEPSGKRHVTRARIDNTPFIVVPRR